MGGLGDDQAGAKGEMATSLDSKMLTPYIWYSRTIAGKVLVRLELVWEIDG